MSGWRASPSSGCEFEMTSEHPSQNSDLADTNDSSASLDPGQIEDQWIGVDRIVAIGDVHGDYPGYEEALSQAKVIDSSGNWVAGETHLVQIGDIPDRGPDSALIIRHMQQLERQAEASGGRVHALIGNHELLNLSGDLYYVHPGEFEALCDEQSPQRREHFQQEESEEDDEVTIMSLYMPRDGDSDDSDIPLGFAEHRETWRLDGEFGRWVASHNTVIKINNILFVHAGISPKYGNWTIRAINERVRQELLAPYGFEDPIAEDHTGPLWYRGLSLDEEAADESHVDALLDFHGVDHIVVGHTPSFEAIVPRYQGKVVVIDSGISMFYGGAVTSLVIENGKLLNLHRGEQIEIPTDEHGLLSYYRRIAELEPASVSLREAISRLEAPVTRTYW